MFNSYAKLVIKFMETIRFKMFSLPTMFKWYTQSLSVISENYMYFTWY